MVNTFNRFSKNEEESYLSRLSTSDRELVKDYLKERSAIHKTLSRGRVKKILFGMAALRSLSPVDFKALTKNHTITIIDGLKKKGWSANTTRDVLSILKTFITWMVTNKISRHLTQDWIDTIVIPAMEPREITAKDLLTDEEIGKITKASSPRDRAIIMLMADCGLRPIEAGSLLLSDLEFKDNNMFVTVISEKTPGKKKIRIIPAPRAMYYVQAWIDQAPYKIEGSDLIFRSSRYDTVHDEFPPLKDDTLRWCIKHAAIRAGVTRYTRPYQLRHGTITAWFDAGLSTAEVATLSHGGPTRILEEVYFHPDRERIGEKVMARVHGVKPIETAKSNPTSRICQTCGRIYPLNVHFCTQCGPISEEGLVTLAAAKARAHGDPRYEELVSRLEKMEKELSKR